MPGLFSGSSRLKPSDLSFLAKELKFLLSSGLPLLRCLEVIERQASSDRVKRSVFRLKEDIGRGNSFSASLRLQGEVYPELFVNVMAAGEANGALAASSSRAARYYGSKDELRKKIASSSVYPCLVLFASFICVIFMGVYLLPTMTSVFAALGTEPPFLTRAVAFAGRAWYLAAFFASVAWLLMKKVSIERIVFRLPVLRTIARGTALSGISETLSALLGSGVPLVASLSIASAASGAKEYSAAVDRVIADVRDGNTLSSSLRRSGVFPDPFCEVASVGETSGNLAGAFEELAAYYGSSAESALKLFAALIEPASTIFVGAIVGVVVFSMFLPMIGMFDSLAK